VTFVVDAQLPPALARVLRDSSCDAVAVREIGLRDAMDSDIWHYAIQRQAAIITKDEDFAERCLYSQNQPVIVWLRIGNTSNQALLNWLIPLWAEIIRRIELGDRLIEVS
jgi:predicted nuclease of predicted toxin-antitoxin system